MTAKFNRVEQKRILMLHSEIRRRVDDPRFDVGNEQHDAWLKAACAALAKEIKAINDKYAERKQA